jgi:hypothetical protein
MLDGASNLARACERDEFLRIILDIEDIGIEAIDAVAHHADAADEDAILVKRQSAGIGREPQRRAFWPDQRRIARRAEPRGKVAARKLAELHAIERAAFQPDGRRRRRKCSWTIWLAVRVEKALPPLDR